MTEDRKINEEMLSVISGGTTQEIAEIKEAILANPNLAGDWAFVSKWAAEKGRKDDEVFIITKILDLNFGESATISQNEENTYFWAGDHSEMLRQIKEYGN